MKPVVLSLLWVLFSAQCVQAVIQWEYESPLTVTETITPLADGTFHYEYSFTNVDTSPIWAFGVFTTFPAYDATTFQPFRWNGADVFFIDNMAPLLDARSLDSNIIKVALTSTCYDGDIVNPPQCPGPNPITVGEAVSGFSFIASVYDPSPKYYFYDTLASDNANNINEIAAVGQTVPEPVTIVLFGFGALVLTGARKGSSVARFFNRN